MNRHASRIGLFALSALSWQCTSSGMNPAATGGNGGTTSTGGHPSTGGAGGSGTGGTGTGGTGTGGTGTGGHRHRRHGHRWDCRRRQRWRREWRQRRRDGRHQRRRPCGQQRHRGRKWWRSWHGRRHRGNGRTARHPARRKLRHHLPQPVPVEHRRPCRRHPDAQSRTGQLSAHRADGVHPLLAGHLRRNRAGQYGRQADGLCADEPDPGHGQRLGRRAQGGRLPSGDADRPSTASGFACGRRSRPTTAISTPSPNRAG